MTNEELKVLKQFSSDILTIKNIANDPEYLERLTKATRESKYLGIETLAQFHDFCGYVEELKGFTFENVTFLDRMADEKYSDVMFKTYQQISEKEVTIQLSDNSFSK